MAEFVPIRIDLADDPKLVRAANELKVTPEHLVGLCVRLWGMGNRLTDDGKLSHSPKQLDAKVGQPGFAKALANVGWLELTAEGCWIHNFEEWNSHNAKERLRKRRNQADHRARENAEKMSPHDGDRTVTESVTTEQNKNRTLQRDYTTEQRLNEDGAIDTCFIDYAPNPNIDSEERTERIRSWGNKIFGKGIDAKDAKSRKFVAQVAAAVVDGMLAEDHLIQALESLKANRSGEQPIKNRGGWFRTALANKRFDKLPVEERKNELTKLLRQAKVPSSIN